jgi:hypothetical protein
MGTDPDRVTARSVTRYCQEDDCPGPGPVGRADALYCSDACRQRAYRRRKAARAAFAAAYGDDPDPVTVFADIFRNAPWNQAAEG